MRYIDTRIVENRSLGGGYFVLRLGGCESLSGCKPGQFIMLRGDWGRDPLLPRPFSILSAAQEGRVDLLAKTFGRGTLLLEKAPPGTRVSVLGPLGNAFPETAPEITDLLVAGGVGLPPLLMQAGAAARRGLAAQNEFFYGGRGARDLVLMAELRGLGIPLHFATEDGSLGRRGRVTAELEARLEILRKDFPNKRFRVLACGPAAMLEAVAVVADRFGIECFVSFEQRMACGFGVCLGCAVPAHSRPYHYVCKDGPVFLSTDVRWHEPSPTPGCGCASPAEGKSS